MVSRKLLRTGLVWPLVTVGLIALNLAMPVIPLALKTLILILALAPLLNRGIGPKPRLIAGNARGQWNPGTDTFGNDAGDLLS